MKTERKIEILDNIINELKANYTEEELKGIGGTTQEEFNELINKELVINIPDNVHILTTELSNQLIPDDTKKVIIPEGCTKIEESVFEDLFELEEVILPNSVKEIGNFAFRNCFALEEISLPDGIENIPRGCFETCNKLHFVKIPESVTEIQEYAFCDCNELTNITLPSGLLKIGQGAFCSAGNSCTYNENTITIPEGIKIIKNNTFADSGIGNIELSNNIKEIEDEAFFNCKNISEIIIPNSVQKIGDRVFMDCENLGEIKMSDNLKSIGHQIFNGCHDLKMKCNSKVKKLFENYLLDLKNNQPMSEKEAINDAKKNDYDIGESIFYNKKLHQEHIQSLKVIKSIDFNIEKE